MRDLLPITFAILTGVFWGMYGPALGISRGEERNAFKPYLAIGLAYLVWGVVGGLIGSLATGAGLSFTGKGISWGFIAGSLGAWGAFTLTLAMFTGGMAKPHVVMPIVFGGAVTVSAFVSIIQTRQTGNFLLWLGVIAIGLGIVLVASNTPHAPPGGHKKGHDEEHAKQPAVAPETAHATGIMRKD